MVEVPEPIRTTVAAVLYGAAGLPVFPCGRDKRPLTRNGFKDATTDRYTIIRLFNKHPDALIGMPTGHASGIFVIDCDVKNGVNGFETLATLGLDLSSA